MWPLPELEGGQAESGPHGVLLRGTLRAARGTARRPWPQDAAQLNMQPLLHRDEATAHSFPSLGEEPEQDNTTTTTTTTQHGSRTSLFCHIFPD